MLKGAPWLCVLLVLQCKVSLGAVAPILGAGALTPRVALQGNLDNDANVHSLDSDGVYPFGKLASGATPMRNPFSYHGHHA